MEDTLDDLMSLNESKIVVFTTDHPVIRLMLLRRAISVDGLMGSGMVLLRRILRSIVKNVKSEGIQTNGVTPTSQQVVSECRKRAIKRRKMGRL